MKPKISEKSRFKSPSDLEPTNEQLKKEKVVRKGKVFPIMVKEDIREEIKELLINGNLNCSFSFDKWNNILLVEVFSNE